MFDKAECESGIASYTVKWVEDIDKINDACEIRIMVDQPNEYMREIIVKKIREKWPNNLKINEIPMPCGIYIMIPESMAKETANKQKECITNMDDKGNDDAWHAEMSKHAKVITSSIFNSTGWDSEELMKSLNFIIDSADKRREMTPEDCLQTFELHHIQSINLIYWGLRLSANMNEQNDDTRNNLHDAIFHACDILRNWTEEEIEGPGITLFELIHLLADNKKDENGDFIDLDYEYFGIFGMNLMHYIKESTHKDFSHNYDAAIDKYNIIAESEHSADAWDIIYKNYIDIYKARHDEQEPDNNPLFTFANDFREWVIFSEIYKSLGINEDETENRYRYYQLCTNKELYNAIYHNINAMQIPDFLVKYEYQVYCAAKSDANSMQIEPMLFILLRFYNTICAWKNFMNTRTAYCSEVKNFDDTLDFLIKNCKSSYLGYLAKRYL